MQYSFGPFRADRAAYQAYRADRPLDLTPKLLDLLFYLLERPATLVTKEELLDGVWPDANVTENALAQAVSDLREALHDSASAPTYIRTVARRGYRFVAPVTSAEPAAPRSQSTPAVPSADAPKSVAVLDFANVTGDADVAWLSAGIAETVTCDLAALAGFQVVDRWRVVQASRQPDASGHDIGAALGAGLVVTGSFQRRGTSLRLTARMIDLATGAAVADAKVDGAIEQVFRLQDEIVATFARELGARRGGTGRTGARETSSLEAFRAYTEGWLKVEALDTDLITAAVADFERAIALDPAYAMAYTGLANAQFVAYETTRVSRTPDRDALGSGIEHARRAVALDDQLAEAHATLSFLLTCARSYDEALGAARTAVLLEPDSWRHQFRLGHASWGTPRVQALERSAALFPQFPYTTLELAMVHVARGDIDLAERAARQGSIEQDRQSRLGYRYPGAGFHWLLGALDAARGRPESAAKHFDHELAELDRRLLYGPEYGAMALVGRGHAELSTGRPADALGSFRGAHEHVEDYARALVGEAAALRELGRASDEAAAWTRIDEATENLRRTDRNHDAQFLEACRDALLGDGVTATTRLREMFDALPSCHLGWTVPIEPSFSGLRGTGGFTDVLSDMAHRAR